MSSIEHLNLVKLIGYAEEGPERVLVVEYVANGNLREHLDGTSNLSFILHLVHQDSCACWSCIVL